MKPADVISPLLTALCDSDAVTLRQAISDCFAPDAEIHLCHPLGNMGAADFFAQAYAPLLTAMPDLEHRAWIVMAGQDDDGADWVGVGGHLTGTFVAPWLNIPPTGHFAHMRCHDFYRIKNGKIVEMQAIWDIPEMMMQANAWPMTPSLGREMFVPGPATQDGLGPHDPAKAEVSKQHIINMLVAMKRHPEQPAEAMELPRFWHPRFNWYGPAGIGTGRGVSGFRNWHQIPYLSGMPDRGQYPDEIKHNFFGAGDYAAVTGWPNMGLTVTQDGWLGIAPAGRKMLMRSLDFWRLEGGKIRENWVLVDLLHMYDQIGVDVLARMREFNKARPTGPLPLAQEVV